MIFNYKDIIFIVCNY